VDGFSEQDVQWYLVLELWIYSSVLQSWILFVAEGEIALDGFGPRMHKVSTMYIHFSLSGRWKWRQVLESVYSCMLSVLNSVLFVDSDGEIYISGEWWSGFFFLTGGVILVRDSSLAQTTLVNSVLGTLIYGMWTWCYQMHKFIIFAVLIVMTEYPRRLAVLIVMTEYPRRLAVDVS
jgi:hypothetical protein